MTALSAPNNSHQKTPNPKPETQNPKPETPVKVITSHQNESYKFLKALTQPSTRKRHKAFLLEGATFVFEALDEAAWAIKLIALTPEFAKTERGGLIIEKAQGRKVSVVLIAPALFDEIAQSETPQGVVAALKQHQTEHLANLQPPEVCTVVVLEGLQDPTNVGAIIRTADATGAFAILYTKGTADPYAPKSVRASAGSILHVPIIPIPSVSEAHEWLSGHRFQLVVTAPHGGENCFTAAYAKRVAIVIGNEAKGVLEETMKMANLSVTIPMLGRAQSLNASVAASILLYELMKRQCRL